MDVVNCKSCGKIFMKQSSDLCPTCMRQDHLNFEKVREFLRERRKVRTSPNDVEIQTGVKRETVFRYIKEGRLLISEISQMEITCESCGNPLMKGRFVLTVVKNCDVTSPKRCKILWTLRNRERIELKSRIS